MFVWGVLHFAIQYLFGLSVVAVILGAGTFGIGTLIIAGILLSEIF
jgi:hypothetical protein